VLGQERYPMSISHPPGHVLRNVYDITADKNGMLWVVSEGGLCSYDGAQFRYYKNTQMSSVEGTSLMVDYLNRVWYCNFDGEIFYVDNDSLQKLNVPKNEAVNFKVIDNVLYMVHMSKLYKYHMDKKIFEEVFDIPKMSYIRFHDQFLIFNDANTRQFIITDLNGQMKWQFELPSQLLPNIVYYKGEWYGAAHEGQSITLYHISSHPEAILKIPHNSNISNTAIHGSYLSLCTKDGWVQINLDDLSYRIRELDVHCLSAYSDAYNNEWIGTYDGLIHYSNNLLSGYIDLEKGIYDFIQYDDQLYIYDRNGTLYQYDKGSDQLKFKHKLSNPHRVYQLIRLMHKNWFKTLFDLHLTTVENKFTDKTDDYVVFNSIIKSVKKLDDKYLSIAMTGACVLVKLPISSHDTLKSIWDKQYYNHYNPGDQNIAYLMTQVRGKGVAFDTFTHRILYSSNLGLHIYGVDSVMEVKYNYQSIYADKISAVDSYFVILSNIGELYVISPQNKVMKLSKLSAQSPILNLRTYQSKIVFWNANNIFITDIQQLNEDTDLHTLRSVLSPVSPSEIINLYFNEERIVLQYNYQLLMIDIQNVKTLRTNYNFAWERVIIDGQSQKIFSDVIIPSFKSNIDFYFSLIDFDREVYSLEYQINDREWKMIAPTERHIQFASLSPGKYEMKIRINGLVQDGILNFIKLKPWYAQWWFYIVALLVVLSIVIFYFIIKLKIQDKENKLILEKNTLEHTLRQSLLSSIKSQMNPHFLFNALNTIQSYIINEDKQNASRYLSMYAKLTRTILEMSDKEYIALDAEIKAFNLYIELERMRFPEIQYELYVDPSINVYISYIPSMIIQPFVENAIKHGLLHSNKEKRLNIDIHKEEDTLIIKIKDNGIGREQSALLNQRKNKSHQSFATRANIKRLELLNLDKNEIVWEYIDHTDEKGEALGTEVILKIPIKYYQND